MAPKLLISKAKIDGRLDQLAAQLNSDYQAIDQLVIIGVLRGAFIFVADLARRLTVPTRIDFLAVAELQGTDTSDKGQVRLIMDLRSSIRDKHVLLVEDIVRSGYTLDYLRRLLWTRDPASLKTCVLMRKTADDMPPTQVDYLGFQTPDALLVGYGLDYGDMYRALPYIGTLAVDFDQDEATA